MPSGKMWYRRPFKPGRHPLPGSDHLEGCIPYLPAFQTETSTGLNTSLVVMFSFTLPISLSTSRQIRLLRDPLYFSSVHMETSAQAQPTLACITLENKAPYVHSQKLHSLCPWDPGLALLSPLPLHGT